MASRSAKAQAAGLPPQTGADALLSFIDRVVDNVEKTNAAASSPPETEFSLANADQLVGLPPTQQLANMDKMAAAAEKKAEGDNTPTHVLQKLAVIVFFYAMSPLVYCNYDDLSDESSPGHSVADAIYFASITLTTVGYGDFTPKTPAMKLFTIFYILFGCGMVFSLIIELGEVALEWYTAHLKETADRLQITATMAPLTDTLSPRVLDQFAKDVGLKAGKEQGVSFNEDTFDVAAMARCSVDEKIAKVRSRKLRQSIAMIVAPIFLGAMIAMHNQPEDMTWVNAIYWATVTTTTVGYGSISLNEANRRFCTGFAVVGVICVSAAIGNLATIQIETEKLRAEIEFEEKQLTAEMLQAISIGKDPRVGVWEFVMATLVSTGKVEPEVVRKIIGKYQELDADGSGELTVEDLREAESQKRRQGLARWRGLQSQPQPGYDAC